MPASDIPLELQCAAQAALVWLNEQHDTEYDLTGVVDIDDDINLSAPFEIGLILCDGEICLREQVRITATGDTFQCERVAQAPSTIPPLLDPPVGIRQGWLDKQLAQYEFVLLLFYRGLW